MKIKSSILEARNTIYEAKIFILFSFFIFILSSIVGYYYLSDAQVIRNNLNKMYEIYNRNNYVINTSRIFLHNAIVAYLSIRLGIVLGILPAMYAIVMGITAGWLFANIKSPHWTELILSLAPHGIFELTAMFISWGIGFWRCKLLFVKNYETAAKENVRKVHKVYICFVVPLLLLAAIAEGVALLLQ